MKGGEQISADPAGKSQYHIIEEMRIILEQRNEDGETDPYGGNGHPGH